MPLVEMSVNPLKLSAPFRVSSYWLIAATLYALTLNVALRLSDVLSVLLFLSGTLTLTIWLGSLVLAGWVQAWRTRQTPNLALGWLLSPLAVLTILGLAIGLTWAAFGLLPWRAVASTDLQPIVSMTSPDQKWRATYVEDLSGGALTGTGEDVYIFKPSLGRLLFKDRVFSAECVQNMSIRWVGSRVLQIEYSSGDAPLINGLQKTGHMPWLHGRDDEERRVDPVRVVQVRHVFHGSFC